jgi:signal transduction histidine kinase
MVLREKGSVAAARWLVAVIAAVTLAFLLETVVALQLENRIASRANQIIGNAMPSVHLLTQALGELDDIDYSLDEYAMSPAATRPMLRDRIIGGEHDVEALFDAYMMLPLFPRESEMAAPVAAQLQAFMGRVSSLRPTTPNDTLIGLHHEIDTIQRSLRQVVGFDATQGERLGIEIQNIRAQTAGAVGLLDGVCVVLAVIAAILAVRVLRRSIRSFERERAAGEKRATELAQLADALEQFSGRVAHDILSPLSSALLSFELLHSISPGDPAMQHASELGMRAIKRVQTLVDGLLAFSRAGGKPEPGVATEITPVLNGVSEELRDQAAQQRITLAVMPPPSGMVACTPGVLESLISNLGRNAIRYMGNATVRDINIRVLDRGERWRFEVEDTGPGIPGEQQHRIFEPHVQLTRSSGIGLGLATVQRLVHAHGGTVGVRSAPGCGALFWFELPKAVPHAADAANAQRAADVVRLEPRSAW